MLISVDCERKRERMIYWWFEVLVTDRQTDCGCGYIEKRCGYIGFDDTRCGYIE